MSEGRKLYDTIMLWVNFGILVALFIKFARKPLMDALHGVRSKLEGEIGEITEQHSESKAGLDSEEAKLRDIQTHLDEIRARIIEMGEKEKRKIIDQAKIAADKMIEDAKAYASFQMEKARKQLSDEMIDIAISMVEKRLAKEITLKDNDKLINDFLANLEATKPHLN
jgi:F-type H+-transporting ATPase subunit b